MADLISKVRHLRYKSPLIKTANTCAICKHCYVHAKEVQPIGNPYHTRPEYACHVHHCQVKLNEWCKHHKAKTS